MRESRPPTKQGRTSGYCFLVVEDSSIMRQLLTFALSRIKNSKIVEANDGADALKKLAAGRFDLIVVDINMPVMDGLKLVKHIREDNVHRDAPIMVVTVESANEDRQRALQIGANAFITKPIRANQVISKAKELLNID